MIIQSGRANLSAFRTFVRFALVCFLLVSGKACGLCPVVYSADRSKAVVPVLFLLFIALCSFVVPALLSVFSIYMCCVASIVVTVFNSCLLCFLFY